MSRHNQFDQSRSIIEIFNQINVKINTFDIEDCHRMGKSKKTTIARFVNRKNCKAVVEKKLSLKKKLDNEKLGFHSMQEHLSAKI